MVTHLEDESPREGHLVDEDSPLLGRAGEDRLERMLRLQLELQVESFGSDPTTMDETERIQFIRWNVLALTDELHEFLNETGWKPWATSRHVNRDAALGELVDAWHFFMNLLLVTVGFGPSPANELSERYLRKREVNAKRQAEGYDGVTGKCPGCKRDLAEVELRTTELLSGTVTYCPCGYVVHR